MPISYPLDFTELLVPAQIEYTAEDLVGMSQSPFTHAMQFYSWGSDVLRFSVSFPPSERADAEALIANLLALRGMEGTFLMRPWANGTPRGSAGVSAAPMVNGGDQAGGSLVTDGWTPSSVGLLLPGDWIGLEEEGVERLHKVLSSVSSDVYGGATLDIWPRLRAAPNDAAPITIINPTGRFRLASNSTRWSIELATKYGISFEAVEDLAQ
jgi:hypothetical protein